MSNIKVLVVGVSIAGPMAAYWLAKAGAHVTVIERFPELRTGGQAIDIRTAGVTVMRKIPGMEAAVRAHAAQLEGISFVDKYGQPIATMEPTGDAYAQSLVSEYEIFRGDLSRVLYDLTKNNDQVRYVFGEQVAALKQKEDESITVEFANGFPAAEFDLVVACDGASSRTRAIGLGCGIRDHIHPLNSWAAWFSVEEDFLKGSKTGKNVVGLMGIQPRDKHDATLPFREAAKQGEPALKQYVARYFEGSGWKSDEVLMAMVNSKDFYSSEMVQVKVPCLTKGRFALVGDAGHATGPTGTGTSLAMTGAYLLAGEICKHQGDLAAGLRGYEERMRPIIDAMQKIPSGVFMMMAPQTAWGIWLRNLLFKFVAWGMRFGKYFSWITARFGIAFGGDEYKLPEYEWMT